MKYFMVLNDGETHTSLNGCKIVRLPDYIDDESANALIEDGDGEVVFAFTEADGGMDIVHRPDTVRDNGSSLDAELEALQWLEEHPDFGV